METHKNDPLASIFINDAKTINRSQLADLITPFLLIDEDSKDFIFLSLFSGIKRNTSKLEILFAGAKARALYLGELDGLQIQEIVATGIMPESSIRLSLKKLLEDRKIKKNKEDRYCIPSNRIPELVKQFAKKNPQKRIWVFKTQWHNELQTGKDIALRG